MYEFTDDDLLDLDLKLITGKTIYLDGISIPPISVGEIAESYTDYSRYLNAVCVKKEWLAKVFNVQEEIKEEQLLPLLLMLIYASENSADSAGIYTDYKNAFRYFTKQEPQFLFEENKIKVGDSLITAQNFPKFQAILRKRNGLDNSISQEPHTDDDRIRQLIEKRDRLRRKLAEIKKQDMQNDITLCDLISIVASGLHLSIQQVCQYDMYQFNDQFCRLRLYKDYDTNVQALLHGAKSDDVKLEHWISKLHQAAP